MTRPSTTSTVEIRLYVSGRSAYTKPVIANLQALLREYDPADLCVHVLDASEAADGDRVFFTPMVVVRNGQMPAKRTVVVGDLRERDALTTVLEGYGIRPRSAPP